MNLEKIKYQINEFQLDKLEEFEKSIGEIKAKKYEWILIFMITGEYSDFIRNMLLDVLKDKSDIAPLVQAIEIQTIEYLKTNEDKEIKDHEFKKNISFVLNMYDLYMEHINSFNAYLHV